MANNKSSRREPARERRIFEEIVVDCYTEEEQRSGWWQYLDDALEFPFKAKCIEKRSISPLKIGEMVKVMNMSASEDCESNIFVVIQWCGRKLGVPLVQLEATTSRAKTKQAIEDWRYWLRF